MTDDFWCFLSGIYIGIIVMCLIRMGEDRCLIKS